MKRQVDGVESDRVDVDRIALIQAVGKALSDPKRIELLRSVADGTPCGCSAQGGHPDGGDADGVCAGVCVCDLVEKTGLIQSLVSYHMRILKDAGLVSEQVRGKWTHYSLDATTMRDYVDTVAALFLDPGATIALT